MTKLFDDDQLFSDSAIGQQTDDNEVRGMRVATALPIVYVVLAWFVLPALADEITSDSEKRSLARTMLDKYKANLGAIRTWKGKVELEEVLARGQYRYRH